MNALVKTPPSRRPALATLVLAALIVLPPPDLAQASHGGPEVDVIVTYERAPDVKEIARLFKLGARVTRLFFRLPMLVLRVPAANVDKLPAGLGVVSVAPDEITAATLVEARPTANEPLSGALGAFRGEGVTVAVIDSGIAPHGDLPAGIRQYSFLDGAYPLPVVFGGRIYFYNSQSLRDPFGHGTHVAGILAGSGAASAGAYRGLATGASLLSLRVLDEQGRGRVSETLAAIDWLLVFHSYFGVRVVNMSLGKSVQGPAPGDPLVVAVERAWDAGLVVVCAAGNFGRDGNFTVTSPGTARKVITVGSVTDAGTPDFTDDFVSTYSSRGPTLLDHVLKPDLIAPGNRVVSTQAEGSQLAAHLPDRLVPCTAPGCTSSYLELSGTSMAAPLVAATAAMMISQEPGLSPATVKARLMRSARKLGDDATAAGAGVLDVTAAMSDTGTATTSLSPRMGRSEAGPVILVEDTAQLWGDEAWAPANVWGEASAWSDGYLIADGYLWPDANLWSGSYLWSDGFLWPDGMWSDGFLWSEGYLWPDVVADAQPLYSISPLGVALNDD